MKGIHVRFIDHAAKGFHALYRPVSCASLWFFISSIFPYTPTFCSSRSWLMPSPEASLSHCSAIGPEGSAERKIGIAFSADSRIEC